MHCPRPLGGLPFVQAAYAFLYFVFKRVIVTPAVYPRLVEFLHFDIQSTGQKSHCVNIRLGPSQCFVLIKQSDSPSPYQF